MLVEGGATLALWPSFELAGCGEQRLNDFVAQYNQSAHGPQALGHHLIATGGFDLAHEVFGAKLLQVIGGVTRAIFVLRLATEGANLASQVRSGKATRGTGQSQHRLGHPAHAQLVEVDSSHPRFPTWEDRGSCSRVSSAIKQTSSPWRALRKRSTMPRSKA